MPIYNVENYLRKCIDSIINQTYNNLEIILVDDGSPDNCGKICDEYAEVDSRIKVIHKENGGLSDARNVGIDVATGKYIAFIDSDDYIDKCFIEYLCTLCKKNDAYIAECDFVKFYDDKIEIINDEKEEFIFNNKEMINRIYNEESYIKTVIVWNKLYKTSLFKDIRFPKGKIHEDEFTTYKLYWNSNNRIAVTNKKLYYYRYNQESIMGSKFSLRRLDYIQALEERLKFFKNKNQIDLYDKTLELYAYRLIEYYNLIKKYVANSKIEQKELLRKFKKNYHKFLNLDVRKSTKIKYLLFLLFS